MMLLPMHKAFSTKEAVIVSFTAARDWCQPPTTGGVSGSTGVATGAAGTGASGTGAVIGTEAIMGAVIVASATAAGGTAAATAGNATTAGAAGAAVTTAGCGGTATATGAAMAAATGAATAGTTGAATAAGATSATTGCGATGAVITVGVSSRNIKNGQSSVMSVRAGSPTNPSNGYRCSAFGGPALRHEKCEETLCADADLAVAATAPAPLGAPAATSKRTVPPRGSNVISAQGYLDNAGRASAGPAAPLCYNAGRGGMSAQRTNGQARARARSGGET
mmetsp:Transcript_164890/g.529234  ORF Transcript_164890/g.529234 Transcript_164890/m.529234 type:complete len:279 (+) Transcript_164890:1126-1962(+)